MASAVLARRNERKVNINPNVPNTVPSLNPNPKRTDIRTPFNHQNSNALNLNNTNDTLEYASFNLNSYSIQGLNELKEHMKSDLDRVRDLQNRINGCIYREPLPPETPHQNVNQHHHHTKNNNKNKRKTLCVNKRARLKLTSARYTKQPVLASHKALVSMMRSCRHMLTILMKHKLGWLFNKPVDVEGMGLFDYHRIIKRPMDLGTVKLKLERNEYRKPEDFAADVRLTFNNAMTYNPEGHEVHDLAETLLSKFENMFKPAYMKYVAETKKVNQEKILPQPELIMIPEDLPEPWLAAEKSKEMFKPAHMKFEAENLNVSGTKQVNQKSNLTQPELIVIREASPEPLLVTEKSEEMLKPAYMKCEAENLKVAGTNQVNQKSNLPQPEVIVIQEASPEPLLAAEISKERFNPAYTIHEAEHLKVSEVNKKGNLLQPELVVVPDALTGPLLVAEKSELLFSHPIVLNQPQVQVQDLIAPVSVSHVKSLPNPVVVTPRPAKLKNPKARDPYKRQMSFVEKAKLGTSLQSLPFEKMDHMVQIVKKRNPNVAQEGDDIVLDFEDLDNETLWELDRFVSYYKKGMKKMKSQRIPEEAAEEELSKLEKDVSCCSSSSSYSSSSDSDSASSCGSDPDEDPVQLPCVEAKEDPTT